MVCPPGVGPGVTLTVELDGQLFNVTVPENVHPGARFRVRLRVPSAPPRARRGRAPRRRVVRGRGAARRRTRRPRPRPRRPPRRRSRPR